MRAKEQAYKYLANRFHFERELLEKLKKKGYSLEVCQETLDSLREEGLLNDDELAYRFAMDKLETEGKSKVLYRLLQKGVEKTLALRAIDRVGIDEYEVCRREVQKKLASLGFSELNGEMNQKTERKLANFLKNKGFPTSMIINSVKECKKQWS